MTAERPPSLTDLRCAWPLCDLGVTGIVVADPRGTGTALVNVGHLYRCQHPERHARDLYCARHALQLVADLLVAAHEVRGVRP